MTANSSKITIHMVSSLDGFIAKKDGDISWLQSTDHYEKGITLSEEGIKKYLEGIDCYVMGSKTYEHALELGWPYGDKPVVVLTNRTLTKDKENIIFQSGDLNIIVSQLKSIYKNIWMVGGAMLTKEFMKLKLVDDIIISIMPITLGNGILFFDYIGQEQALHLKDVTAYKDGMVELWYEVRKS